MRGAIWVCSRAVYLPTSTTILTFHRNITFDLLYAILVPRSLIVAHCAISLLLLFKLKSFTNTLIDGHPAYQLTCESVDLVDHSPGVGRVQTPILPADVMTDGFAARHFLSFLNHGVICSMMIQVCLLCFFSCSHCLPSVMWRWWYL